MHLMTEVQYAPGEVDSHSYSQISTPFSQDMKDQVGRKSVRI